MPTAVDDFIHHNQARFLAELKELLRIPSISTLPEHRGDVEKAAAFVAGSLRTAGMENVEIIPTAKHPLVYAEWLHAPGKPSADRAAHLFDVRIPMLFLQGTRDAIADLTHLQPAIDRLGHRATLVIFEGADHSFHVPKASGRTDAALLNELLDATARWVQQHARA